MESGGVGEIAFRPGGLMQDPTQLQQMEQQQGKRQQMVLGGCRGRVGRQKSSAVVRTAGVEGQLRAQLQMESLWGRGCLWWQQSAGGKNTSGWRQRLDLVKIWWHRQQQ